MCILNGRYGTVILGNADMFYTATHPLFVVLQCMEILVSMYYLYHRVYMCAFMGYCVIV